MTPAQISLLREIVRAALCEEDVPTRERAGSGFPAAEAVGEWGRRPVVVPYGSDGQVIGVTLAVAFTVGVSVTVTVGVTVTVTVGV